MLTLTPNGHVLNLNRHPDETKVAATATVSLAPTAVTTATQLPSCVDNRPFCPPVYDQGGIGACTGFSIAKGMLEILRRKAGLEPIEMSAMFLYWNERSAEHTTKIDAGAHLTDGLAVLLHEGCAPESEFPLTNNRDPNAVLATPPPSAFEAAKQYRITDATHLYTLEAMKYAVANQGCFVGGFDVFSGDAGLEGTIVYTQGRIAMPSPGDALMGAHALCIVGYDDTTQMFLVRNSWGSGYGLGGYFWMPYAYALAYGSDCWTASL